MENVPRKSTGSTSYSSSLSFTEGFEKFWAHWITSAPDLVDVFPCSIIMVW